VHTNTIGKSLAAVDYFRHWPETPEKASHHRLSRQGWIPFFTARVGNLSGGAFSAWILLRGAGIWRLENSRYARSR